MLEVTRKEMKGPTASPKAPAVTKWLLARVRCLRLTWSAMYLGGRGRVRIRVIVMVMVMVMVMLMLMLMVMVMVMIMGRLWFWVELLLWVGLWLCLWC